MLFQSLPSDEQQRHYRQWAARQQQPQQPQPPPPGRVRETPPRERQEVERRVSDFFDDERRRGLPESPLAAMQLMMLEGVIGKADRPHYERIREMVEEKIDEQAREEERREEERPWWKRMLDIEASRRVAARWTQDLVALQVRAARVSPKYTKLHIFDFDGTLFRSPGPPDDAEEPESWWSSPESLAPETVGEKPSRDMWHPESVKALRDAVEDPDSYVVVMTGRHRSLRHRIGDILESAGLRPDELITNPEIGNTTGYKRDEMRYLLHQLPNVREVNFWEDRKADLKGYQRLGEKRGIRFVPHHVENFEDEDPPYVGVFLTPESREQLLKDFPPRHDDVQADHVTLAFRPTEEQMEALTADASLGEHMTLKVVGLAEDDKGQVLEVELPGGVERPDGRTPHVTVSVTSGTPPIYSNELVGQARPVAPRTYEGYVDKGPRRRAPETAPTPEGDERRRRWRDFLEGETRNPEYGRSGVKERVKRKTLYDSGGPGRRHVMREWARSRR